MTLKDLPIGKVAKITVVGGNGELRQHFLAVSVFVHHPLGDENGVVVSLPEDERGKDNVDDVEFHIENAHQSENPDPRQR